MSTYSFPPPSNEYQRSGGAEFTDLLQRLVSEFPRNSLAHCVVEGKVTVKHYHSFLNMIFHQTYESASTFALAGANCDLRRYAVRDYLIEHAEEEKDHWQWVIEDLHSTGFAGPDPRTQFPHPACQKYIAFNLYIAVRMPIARLASAAFLEGVGAAHGKKYAMRLCQVLNLSPAQTKFLFGHGDTDVGHTDDILRVLTENELTQHEWAWMCHSACTAAALYAEMYEAVVK